MRKIFAAAALFATVIGCGAEKEAEFQVNMEDTVQKRSYAVGADIARTLAQQDITISHEAFSKGFRDQYLTGEALLTSKEITETVRALQQEKVDEQKAIQDKAGEESRAAGEKFLAENKTKEGVVALESGLQYKIIKEGSGRKPEPDDTITFHYEGRLVDGMKFDSSYDRNHPLTYPLGKLIPGWVEALQLMSAGSLWELYIPSDLAYGPRGSGRVPANAALVFKVELIEIKEK